MGLLFEEYQARLVKTGPNQEIVERDFGAEKDTQAQRITEGVLSNLPGKAPSDAIPYIGADRMLPQAVGESLGDYTERLRTAWDSVHGWSYAGSHGSILRALARAGFPTGTASGANLIQRTKRYSYLAAGVVTFGTHSGWTFDSTPAAIWNQFGILFGADVSGLTEGSESHRMLNRIVRIWKPAKARFMGTHVVTTQPVWGWPTSTNWAQASLDWGESGSRFLTP